jgi:hypothetical protein
VGAFYHCGGGVSGFEAALTGGVWGAIVAAVALALIAKVGGGPLVAAICVGITVAIFILRANISLLTVIPAAVYGYSAVAALEDREQSTHQYCSFDDHRIRICLCIREDL